MSTQNMSTIEQPKYLTADERDLMTHISRFGSSGYPLVKLGKSWSWNYRDSISSAEKFPTRKAAIASFEAYHSTLIDQYALESIDPGFRTWLEEIAHLNSQKLFDVFLLWRKYCRDCQGFDQSPVMGEFLQWNNLQEPERV